MANHMVSSIVVNDNVVDKRRTTAAGNSATSNSANHAARTNSIADMRTRLTAINATSYSATRLDTMTVNDMLYAIRLADEAAGL